MLDNTLIIYGSAMGNSNLHNHKRCPLFFAGHAGGALKGNRHIRAAEGTPMANALLPALRGLGVEVDTFGDSTGVLDLNALPATTDAAKDVVDDAPSAWPQSCAAWRSSRRSALVRGTTPVADAAQAGDAVALRALLKQGADVNSSQGDGMTALHWAALHGDTTMVSMLVAAGANLRATTRLGGVYAAPSRQPERPVGRHRRVDCRRRRRSRAHIAPARPRFCMPRRAGDVEGVSRLLAGGADVNAAESAYQQTPLMIAAGLDRAEVVTLLLAKGADADRVVGSGRSAITDGAERRRSSPASRRVARRSRPRRRARRDATVPLQRADRRPGRTDRAALRRARRQRPSGACADRRRRQRQRRESGRRGDAACDRADQWALRYRRRTRSNAAPIRISSPKPACRRSTPP